MLTAVSAVQARQQFGELLNTVALRNEEITIERAGKPLVKVVPIQHQTTRSEPLLDLRDARGLATNAWQNVDATVWIEQERNAWD